MPQSRRVVAPYLRNFESMSFTISIQDSGETFLCGVDQNVLAAMESLGRSGIPVGCRGGGCGICRVQVVGGAINGKHYRTLKMSKTQVSDEDRRRGIALACKLIPLTDLTVKPLGLLHKRLGAAAEFLLQTSSGV